MFCQNSSKLTVNCVAGSTRISDADSTNETANSVLCRYKNDFQLWGLL